jgi:dynamin 1-like protein
VSEEAFEILIKKQIMRLLSPSIECSRLVFEEIKKVYSNINLPEIQRFEKLKYNLTVVLEKVLLDAMRPTEQMIKNLVDIELGHINTDHPDFCNLLDIMEESIPKEEEMRR